MNEVLIYGPIFDFTAQAFVQSFAEIEGDEVVCRINTDGGEPEAGWSMLAKLQEFPGKKTVKVDGKAYSMGAFSLLYADDSECLDVSQFLIHRCAYSAWYEQEYMTEPQAVNLANINKKLREAFEAKIDVAKFENLKSVRDAGVTVDRIFSMEERVDCFLTADEAKKIGLVKRIVKLTPQKASAINASLANLAKASANYRNLDNLLVSKPEKLNAVAANIPSGSTEATQKKVEIKPKNNNTTKNNSMTVEDFKRDHPEAYAAIVGIGVAQERDRVGAYCTFIEIDPVAVKEGIMKGEPLSQTAMAEFTLKAVSKERLASLEDESKKNGGKETTTGEPENVAQKTASDNLSEQIRKNMNLKPAK